MPRDDTAPGVGAVAGANRSAGRCWTTPETSSHLRQHGRLCDGRAWNPSDDTAVWFDLSLRLSEAARRYAEGGWAVLPVVPCGKNPLNAHGVTDATDDLDQVDKWWGRWPDANIGGRIPAGVVVLDIDAAHHGPMRLAGLEAELGPLPATLICLSGSGGGSRHHYYRHPGGKLRHPAEGVEVWSTPRYQVLPPSVHPSLRQYHWIDPTAPIVELPAAWVARLRPPTHAPKPRPQLASRTSDGPADRFCAAHRWADVLVGWQLVTGDGEGDGSRWRHPRATAEWSGTIRHGLLFCYSPNTALPVTVPGAPAGLTKFRAWAHLEHAGDLSAAARAWLMTEGVAA